MTDKDLIQVNKHIEEVGLENIDNVVIIANNATNGEVIRTVFKEIVYWSDGKISAKWWNEKYKGDK